MASLALGIDIGGTNTKFGLIHSDGRILDHSKIDTLAEEPFSNYLDRVEIEVKRLITPYKNKVMGIGLGAPCASAVTGLMENPPNLQVWGTLPLQKLFHERFQLPVFLDNDANISAVGEGQWGVAKGLKNFVVITLGTGVGTGIIVNGQMLTGTSGFAGEGGHIIIHPEGRPCSCGGIGHLEAYCSVKGIKQTYKELFNEETGFREMSVKYFAGDSKALKCVETTADHLGWGLATMSALFLPDMFVLGGGVSSLGDNFATLVEASLNRHVFPSFRNKVPVKISSISTTDGAIMGAASLVFSASSV
ncbi:MAG: ROK family protein [Bacteriovoracaceae bacterium]